MVAGGLEVCMAKEFNAWNRQKKRLDRRKYMPSFKEREIWWCSIGVNVAHEQDGKNATFNRPVLVVRKFSRFMFWGVPLSTVAKENPFYIPIELQDMTRYAMISQLRTFASKRLEDKIARVPESDFQIVVQAISGLLVQADREQKNKPHKEADVLTPTE